MTRESSFALSVIIPTKDRAEQLSEISLPSLAKQTSHDFEIIVWDASGDNSSRLVVEDLAVAHPDLVVRYFQAPRSGLPAQRNDSAKAARGEIVFFIDDDCEVSPDGIDALIEMFAQNRSVDAGCLVLETHWAAKGNEAVNTSKGFGAWLLTIGNKVFAGSSQISGIGPKEMPVRPGPVDFLPGCDFAVRASVLKTHAFDERLQRYAGYALWEDQLFSHQLYREGLVLSVAGEGKAVHHSVAGGRVRDLFNRGCLEGYNAGIVWIAGVFPYDRRSILPFIWARIGFLGVVLFPCLCKPWEAPRWKRAAGYLRGLWVFFWEECFVFPSRA
jgi:glycosyltransferase involved in cell wall biosynthesis